MSRTINPFDLGVIFSGFDQEKEDSKKKEKLIKKPEKNLENAVKNVEKKQENVDWNKYDSTPLSYDDLSTGIYIRAIGINGEIYSPGTIVDINDSVIHVVRKSRKGKEDIYIERSNFKEARKLKDNLAINSIDDNKYEMKLEEIENRISEIEDYIKKNNEKWVSLQQILKTIKTNISNLNDSINEIKSKLRR